MGSTRRAVAGFVAGAGYEPHATTSRTANFRIVEQNIPLDPELAAVLAAAWQSLAAA